MATYLIDPSHSEIAFSVKHLMITHIRGFFAQFEGTLDSRQADFTDASIRVVIDVNSLYTNHPQRDAHLKSDDFFAAAAFPVIEFQSTTFIKINATHYLLNGFLKIRDIQEPVQLKTHFRGKGLDNNGDVKYGFELDGQISRKEFGLFWNQLTAAGNGLISDDVHLHMNIQLLRN